LYFGLSDWSNSEAQRNIRKRLRGLPTRIALSYDRLMLPSAIYSRLIELEYRARLAAWIRNSDVMNLTIVWIEDAVDTRSGT
jgi:hypothetical protein